jgi:hypothetical protein
MIVGYSSPVSEHQTIPGWVLTVVLDLADSLPSNRRCNIGTDERGSRRAMGWCKPPVLRQLRVLVQVILTEYTEALRDTSTLRLLVR